MLVLASVLLSVAPPSLVEALEVRLELAQMVAIDQSFRKAMGEKRWSQAQRDELVALYEKKLGAIDAQHTARLKTLIAKYGWLKSSIFGEDAAHDAWLLIQHADRDREFQKQMLPKIEAAARVGDADLQSAAYLADRVLVHEDKPQRYGTQGRCVGKQKWEPRPIEAREKVDERRKALGMKPLAEYVKDANEMCLDADR